MAALSPRTQTLSIGGPLEPGDLPELLERSRALLAASHVELLVCAVGELTADLLSVEALARIALVARRGGCRVVLAGAAPQLRALVGLLGLAEVLPCAGPGDAAAVCLPGATLGVEMLSQAEQGEERVGREEKRELDDPAF